MNAPKQLRGGLIGCGFVSQHHIEGWKTIPTARIVALCDLDPSRLQSAGSRLPEARLYADAMSMLTSESLDFVEICTPPESHQALVELAAGRGLHILCQKPAAPTRPELLAMLEACDSA
ncbi:Gfo/Idh/MocA family protein, partial [Singulisphaera rosea]